jgi:hypothetical protein
VNAAIDYDRFLTAKAQSGADAGFDPIYLPSFLFGFQRELVEHAVRRGRSAVFADCGLGKTPMGLVWADNVVRKTAKPVLVLTPPAVGAQMEREAEKFGIEAKLARDGVVRPGINLANYERLHYFDPDRFAGVVCDESSILKAFDGVRRNAITEFLRKVPYRLLQTATAAPNDYIELGTSSEALGYLGHIDMLNRFFKNDLNNSATGRMHGKTQRWRFKGHAETPFWRWVCSWARAVRRPSDLGFNDGDFVLPPLVEQEHIVQARSLADGELFALPAVDLRAIREERRRTLTERCERAAALVADTAEPALVWCQLNEEGDLLEKLIPDAVQVAGSDSEEAKEERLLAFARGEIRVLVTKPKIGAWGLNFQHCAHVVYFPSYSFEQYYQAIRRCWRFGQKRPVNVDIVASEGGRGVLESLQQKSAKADAMFTNLVSEMQRGLSISTDQDFPLQEQMPAWL